MTQHWSGRGHVVVLTTDEVGPPSNLSVLEDLADVVVTDARGLPEALPGAPVLLMWDFFSTALADAWDSASDLQWVHVAAAGVDTLLFDGLRESEVVVSNARGVFDRPIAEFVAAAVLAHDKQLHESKRLQRAQVWQHRELTRTEGSRALVVGAGGIGRACAQVLAALGMDVTVAARTAREDPELGHLIATDDLLTHLRQMDHVVLAAPLTDQTRGVIGAEQLAAMKPTAHLVNVGRGPLVDEAALVDALRDGSIAAATLDVFENEPLPEDHPFWTMEHVHVSAHMCGDVVGWRDALAGQFEDNLRRWLRGESPHNVVDKTLGFAATTPVGQGAS